MLCDFSLSESTSPRCLKRVSNETPSDFSVVHHQSVSVVRIHDVPLACFCDVSCNSQKKHALASPPRLGVMLSRCFVSRSYYVFNLLRHDLHLIGFHVSFKYQIQHQIFLIPTRMETIRVVWIINQQNFYYI